jgi:hypothetical protein
MTMAGVASASSGDKDKCLDLWLFTYCPKDHDQDRGAVKAPEIDPASAMAGLTMLVGGLAVLRGRRRAK